MLSHQGQFLYITTYNYATGDDVYRFLYLIPPVENWQMNYKKKIKKIKMYTKIGFFGLYTKD